MENISNLITAFSKVTEQTLATEKWFMDFVHEAKDAFSLGNDDMKRAVFDFNAAKNHLSVTFLGAPTVQFAYIPSLATVTQVQGNVICFVRHEHPIPYERPIGGFAFSPSGELLVATGASPEFKDTGETLRIQDSNSAAALVIHFYHMSLLLAAYAVE